MSTNRRPWFRNLPRWGSSHNSNEEDTVELIENGNNKPSTPPAPGIMTVSKQSIDLRHTNWLFQTFPFLASSTGIIEPSKKYKETKTYAFVDAINRSAEVPLKDTYLSPSNGKLKELIVQASTEALKGDATWGKRKIENVGFRTVRLVDNLYQEHNVGMFIVKWIGTSLALPFTLLFARGAADIRWGGNYSPFPYKYRGYPKATRNIFEGQHPDPHCQTMSAPDRTRPRHERLERCSRPPTLNIQVRSETNPAKRGRGSDSVITYEWKATSTEDWRKKEEQIADPDYVFITYTRDHFAPEDDDELHELAQKATRYANLSAYWLDNCLSDNVSGNNLNPDVYRISDYVRQANSVVIIVGHLQDEKKEDSDIEDRKKMLKDLGLRVWTFPELLLANGNNIDVWMRGSEEPLEIPKTQIADIVWSDSERSADLVNYIRGTIRLSGLELFTMSLKCFHSRILHRRTKSQDSAESRAIAEGNFQDRDKIYALAGLLRVRPLPDVTDTAFQAFARLSFANDSDQLLERFICMLPKPTSPDASWQTMQDAWEVEPWDILPQCQISGIGEDDTVIIDGARGASVRWKGFEPVAEMKKASWKRFFARILLRAVPMLFWIAFIIISFGVVIDKDFVWITGVVVSGLGTLTLFSFPALIRRLFSGKAYNHQAWLFGFEGYMSIEEIERHIWNTSSKRLGWSPCGSSISQHHRIRVVGLSRQCQEAVHIEGADPMSYPHVKDIIGKGRKDGFRVFTLVDTVTMTVFLFLAKRPPVAFLVCGQEGGMQRAVGVSYDHTTETVHKETVLRMETTVLNRMSRVPRCRIGFGRDEKQKWATL